MSLALVESPKFTDIFEYKNYFFIFFKEYFLIYIQLANQKAKITL